MESAFRVAVQEKGHGINAREDNYIYNYIIIMD